MTRSRWKTASGCFTCGSWIELEDLPGPNSSHSLLKRRGGDRGDGPGRGRGLLRVSLCAHQPCAEASRPCLELRDAVMMSSCRSPAVDAFMSLRSPSCGAVKELCCCKNDRDACACV